VRDTRLNRLGALESIILKVNSREGPRQQITRAHQNHHRQHEEPQTEVASARNENCEADEQTDKRSDQREVADLHGWDRELGHFLELKNKG